MSTTPLPTDPAAISQMANPPQAPTPATTGNPVTPTPTPTMGQPSVTPGQGQPQNQPTANAPSPNQPHLNIYDKILRATAPPPVRYVDAQGNLQTAPQTRGSLGRSVLASVVAGLLTPTQYRQGAFGPVVDSQATAAAAFKAGADQQTKEQTDAQAQADKMQANKLMAVKNNVDVTHAYAALAQQKHQDLQGVIDSNSSFLKDLDAYDAQQSDPANKLILSKGLTYQQALASPQWGQGSLTKNNLVMSGQQETYDTETGKTNIEPLYTIINPNGKIKMSADAVAKLSTINPSFQAAFDGANGDMRFPVHQYVAAMNQLNTVKTAESFFKRADEALGVSDKFDLAAAVRKDNRLMPAINAAENALAQGGSTADALQRVQQSPNSSAIFDAMGISQDDVTKYIQKVRNEEARQAALAKEGGIGDKAPAPQQMTNEIIASAKNLPKDQRDAMMAGVNPNGLTVGEAEKLKDNILKAIQQNRTDAANNPKLGTSAPPANFVSNPNASTMDSVDLQKDLTAKGVKLPPNFETLYGIAHNANPLTTLPPNPRKGSNQMSAQEGLAFIRQYINPQYQEGDYAAAAGLSKELASTKMNTAGGTLYNAGTASQHLELLAQAADALKNNDTQALNHLANALGVQLGKSPAVTFQAIADQANGEVAKVVAGGKPNEPELQALRTLLNTDQSPEQTRNVIKSYVNLMAGRINEINERSQQYFNRDVKGISPETAKVFAKYGAEVPGYVTVQIQGQKPNLIAKSQLAAFRAKYPNATIGGQ